MIFSKILAKQTSQQALLLNSLVLKQARAFAIKQGASNQVTPPKDKSLKNPIEQSQYTAFLFDETNMTPIFDHMLGERDLRIGVRVFTAFTILNALLAIAEYQYPVFGGWNGMSFSLCTLTGLGLLSFLNIFSKRTIHSLKLMRSGDFVEAQFFNAFWVPQTKMIHVSEFANMQASYMGYSRSELTTFGKVWINLEKNAFFGNKAYEDILIEILNGKTVRLDSYVLQRATQYLKKK